MLNNSTYIGRLTKDPDLKHFEGEKCKVSFTIAVQRDFKNSFETYDADFIPCFAWDARAKVFAQHLKKGSLVAVIGKMRSRSYDGTNGKVYVLELQIENLDFLEKKKKDEGNVYQFSDNPLD